MFHGPAPSACRPTCEEKIKNVSVQEVGFSIASIFNSFSCNKSHPVFVMAGHGDASKPTKACADDTDLPTIWIFQTYLDQHVSIKLSEFMG